MGGRTQDELSDDSHAEQPEDAHNVMHPRRQMGGLFVKLIRMYALLYRATFFFPLFT